MKIINKYLAIISLLIGVFSCTNEDIVVTYPSSIPQIDTAKVTETTITYGDSIHLKIATSDKIAPLSTILIRVVVNNDIVASETVRTKGNQSSFTKAYHVPFVANRPDNAAVKVYLTLTNVSGIEKDSIVNSTIAKRPSMPDIWLVTSTHLTTYKIPLKTDTTAQNIYVLNNLSFTNSISFRLATKVNAIKKVDWTGLVFAKNETGFGLTTDPLNDWITIFEPTLFKIKKITIDMLNFTIKAEGQPLEPVNTLDVNLDLVANPSTLNTSAPFRGGNVYFGENMEVTFTGLTGDIANNVSPDYFIKTGTNKAKFLGKTGIYKAYYLIASNYIYIDPQPETLYPEVLWVCGTGYGRPSSPYGSTASWNWNSPMDYYPARLVSPGVYQVTMYCKNEPGKDKDGNETTYGTLNFKFFHKRGWWDGHETWVDDYTVQEPFLGPTGVGGNIKVLSATVVDGVYKFTLNTNSKTLTYEKLN